MFRLVKGCIRKTALGLLLASLPAAAGPAPGPFAAGAKAFADEQFPVAVKELERFIRESPADPRVPRALLMVGHSHLNQDNVKKAREAFTRVKERHADTEEAGKARLALEAILLKHGPPTPELPPLYWFVSAGMRVFAHFNFANTLTTPPPTYPVEAQLSALLTGTRFEFYASLGAAFSTPSNFLAAGGARYYFVRLRQARPSSLFREIGLSVIVDAAYYSMPAPPAPSIYQHSGLVFRYGAGLLWRPGTLPFELEVHGMVSRVSENWFMAPFAGLRFAL